MYRYSVSLSVDCSFGRTSERPTARPAGLREGGAVGELSLCNVHKGYNDCNYIYNYY